MEIKWYRQLRLCYIASANSIHTKRWVNYFAWRGHEVHLISFSFSEGYEGIDSRVHMHPLIKKIPHICRISIYIGYILWLFQVRLLVRKIKPDILHAHYITENSYLGVASGFHPLILTAWGSDILIAPENSLKYRFLTKKALKRADRVICVSTALKEEIIELGGAPNKIVLTPIGIDTQEFSPVFRNEGLLQEFDIAGSPIVISTRSLKPVYDVETLIRTIPLVLQQIPEAMFVVAGEGEQRVYLENLAQSLEVYDSIRFVGWIPNNKLPKYLASSDVYVSTSLSDGTSISLLEALSCELAPVVNDIPANRPWVTDGENGFLVPIGDYEKLASRISLLLKDNETRTRFGNTGRIVVMKRAEHENEMYKVEGIYEKLKYAKS